MGEYSDFSTFCGNLRVKNLATIRVRYADVTQKLNQDFWGSSSTTEHSLYAGSYGRGTAIDGTSDIDFYMRLPNEVYHRYGTYYGNGQSALLQSVKNSLRGIYPRTDLRGDGQVVVVNFVDGMKLEVVPVFNTAGLPDYIYPDTNGGGQWRYCYPKDERRAFSTANQNCNGNLINLCRMARAWRRQHNVPMSGILIDKLASDFLQGHSDRNQSYGYYDRFCRDFFLYLSRQNRWQTSWGPLGNGYAINRTGQFEHKAELAYKVAATACDYSSESTVVQKTARQKWRGLFGNFFPV